MNSVKRQYLFGLFFIAVAMYQVVAKDDYFEFSMYAVAGAAFIVNGMSSEPRLISIRKPLVIAAWFLIISAAILFLYLLQFRF